MGITQVDPREAERFEEGLDFEYHDAENPPTPETLVPTRVPSFSHEGCGSSSLRECIELLRNTRRMPLLPSTLGSKMRNCQGRSRLRAQMWFHAI